MVSKGYGPTAKPILAISELVVVALGSRFGLVQERGFPRLPAQGLRGH
jgi:hypothetical protein